MIHVCKTRCYHIPMKLFFALSIFFMSLTNSWGQAANEKAASTKPMAAPAPELNTTDASAFKNNKNYWKELTKTDAMNQAVWVSYFDAAKFSNYDNHSRSLSKTELEELEGIRQQVAAILPNTYAHFYIEYQVLGKTKSGFSFLEKAYQANPDASLIDDMLAKAIIERNDVKKKEFVKKLYDSGLISAALLEYNQNVLYSLEENANLVTYGYADTYPLYILQELFEIRRDVRIVCLEWLINEDYNTNWSNRLGYPNKLNPKENVQLAQILNKHQTMAIYVGFTLPPSLLATAKDNFYCTGLALKYSPTPIGHLTSLKSNWETLFKKKQIEKDEDINANYLIPLLMLEKMYISEGGKKTVRPLIDKLAQRYAPGVNIQKQLK